MSYNDDDTRPARGCLHGLALGVATWALVALAVWVALT
jgi:hypothetical protein